VTQIVDIFVGILREAWVALASALLIFAVLAVLAQVLRASSASVIGARFWVWEAVSVGIALLVLALFAFLGVPSILQAAQSVIPPGGGCGPIVDLGAFAAGLIAALAALRILKALLSSTITATMGGGSSLSSALLETGEAVLGMMLASAAIPVAVHFLGVC
jgi:ABC-type arginine transport system permease subunit